MNPYRDGSLSCTVDSDLSARTLEKATPEQADLNGADRAASRSQLGYEISLAGGTLEAVSRRQHSTSVDTAGAEIFAASVAAGSIYSISGVLFFISFGILGNTPVPLFCDNSAAVSVARDSASAKRLPFVTRRIRLLHELHQRGVINVCEEGVPGTANPSDALTKHLSPKVFKAYMARLYNCSESAI
jgi:hypothetical protein